MDLNSIRYTPILTGIRDEKINWTILINDKEFSYFQGLGYLKKQVDKNDSRSLWNGIDLAKLSKDDKIKACKAVLPYGARLTVNDFEWTRVLYVKNPRLEDILHCLFLDAQAHDVSFQDWCSDFGYNSDSIKAKKIYDACLESYYDLKKALGSQYDTVKSYIESLEL